MLNPWITLSFKAIQLGIEAQNVVGLRLMCLASGGQDSRAEFGRMIVEKGEAVAEAQFAATAAAAAGNKDHVIVEKTLDVFRTRVRANSRRLSRR
jgi:hypothetical protein